MCTFKKIFLPQSYLILYFQLAPRPQISPLRLYTFAKLLITELGYEVYINIMSLFV